MIMAPEKSGQSQEYRDAEVHAEQHDQHDVLQPAEQGEREGDLHQHGQVADDREQQRWLSAMCRQAGQGRKRSRFRT